MRATARQTCTDHCSSCGQHFHGLGAYDLHRAGEYGKGQSRGDRQCLVASHVEKLAIWTSEGFCDLAVPKVSGVLIWQRVGTAERLAKAGLSQPSSRRGSQEAVPDGSTLPLLSGE